MKSIVQTEARCYVCGCVRGLEVHHIMPGTANRKLSTKYGLVVYLCREHHTGKTGVHTDHELMIRVKMDGQRAFESIHGHQAWMDVFGKNYL